jgi:stearoyl-CoA desaturase (delta-9 desaturase)
MDSSSQGGDVSTETTGGGAGLELKAYEINWVTAVFLIVTPLIGLVWGALHTSWWGVAPAEIGLFLFFVSATALSITAGYHRLFAHRAYECSRAVKLLFLLFGAAAFQQSVLNWASDHRRHHKNVDRSGDPYNIARGFFWAHVGWLLVNDDPRSGDYSNVPDLVADPLIRLQDRFYIPLAIVMCFFVPFGFGYLIGHPWGCLLWAGVIRVVVVHHSTFLVNSLAHTLGRRPYSRTVSARDSLVTALLTFGEGYHNFHHRFAADYRNGVRLYQFDPTKWLIRVLAAVGLAWNLRRVRRERIIQAELDCDSLRFVERWKGRSEQALAYLRERTAEIKSAVERSANRLGDLEREFARVRKDWRVEGHERVERLRTDLRAARRELRAARSRWRAALTEIAAQPLPAFV